MRLTIESPVYQIKNKYQPLREVVEVAYRHRDPQSLLKLFIILPILAQFWSSVPDAGPTLNQKCSNFLIKYKL